VESCIQGLDSLVCPQPMHRQRRSVTSSTVLVSCRNRPSGPVKSSPRSRAACTKARTASRSTSLADPAGRFFGGVVALTTSSVSVIIRPSSPAQLTRQAIYTVRRAVPRDDAPATLCRLTTPRLPLVCEEPRKAATRGGQLDYHYHSREMTPSTAVPSLHVL
jgi:hypothetical protein